MVTRAADMAMGVAKLWAGVGVRAEAAAAALDQALVTVANQLGVPPPAFEVTEDAGMALRAFRVGWADGGGTVLRSTAIPAGSVLVQDTAWSVCTRIDARVIAWADPAAPHHAVACVTDMPLAVVRAAYGKLALDVGETLGSVVARWLRRAAAERFDDIAAAQVLARLLPQDAAALLRCCPVKTVAGLLRGLLDQGLGLGDFRLVAPLLADESRVCWMQPGAIGAALPGRLALGAPRPEDDSARWQAIARGVMVPRLLRRRAREGPLQVWMLTPEAEAACAGTPGEDRDWLRQAAVAALAADGVVLASAASLAAVVAALRLACPDLCVAGLHELPRGIAVQKRGTIGLGPNTAANPGGER